jgi:hypothetical protein
MGRQLSRGARILLGIGAPTAIALVCIGVYTGRLSVPCVFYESTGLYCPGCGSGRAIYALLHGRFREAFFNNMMLFILGVPAAGVLLIEYLRLVFPPLGIKPVALPRGVASLCAVLIIGYWIARNIPALSILAPGG